MDPEDIKKLQEMSGLVGPDPYHLLSTMETWQHKHMRSKHSIHTDRDMQTRGRGEERLELLGDNDQDPRLDEAPTAWRERGPRTADGPAERA